jgi:large subunit ribosomal protein L21
MYAIAKIGGKQYRVEEGLDLVVEKICEVKVGQEIIINDILLFVNDKNVIIGKPLVKGINVTAMIIAQKRASKVLVFKKNPKKGYKKLQGHRQYVTELKITKISINA